MRFFSPVLLAAILLGAFLSSAHPATQVDPLTPTAARGVGQPLSKSSTAQGGGIWTATAGTVIGENGATANVPASAHVVIPAIAGKIRLEADVSAKGSAFTGLALGHGNLSGDFWRSLTLMVTVMPSGNYNVFAANKNLIANPDKSLLHEGSNHLEFELDTMAHTYSLRFNGKSAVENAAVPKEVSLDNITAAGFRFHEPVVALQPSISNFKVEQTSLAAGGLELVDVGMCFVVPDELATLRFKVASRGPRPEVPYLMKDYEGRAVASGTATIGPDGTLSSTARFAHGYHELVFPEANQSFGVVSLTPQAGPADPFFCLDASLSWLELDPVKQEALVKIMARSGVAMARERFGSVFTPTPGTYNWEGGKKLDSVRKMYTASKVGVLEILGSGAKQFGMVPGQIFPQNLPMVASEWVGVIQHWEHVWGGAEVYNESDLRTVPAEQYVPMAKALSYSLAEAKSKVPLVTGVFATAPPGPYFETSAANGLLADSDVVSFHAYDRPPDIEGMVVRFREWMKKSGAEATPLWLTECGKAWVNGPARPPQDQDAVSASEIAAMGVEARAAGVARYFPFVYVYYEEGLKNFGMMARDATPLRSMAAYVQSIQALSGRSYLGDLSGLDPSVRLARVFGTDKDCVVVLYTGTIDAKAAVAFPYPCQRATGADGRQLQIASGKVPVPDGLTYLWVNRADLGSALKTGTGLADLYKLGQNPTAPKRLASPVIIQFLAQNTPARSSARRYIVTQETARELPLSVRIHNLSNAPLSFTPEVSLPDNTSVKKDTLSVPAMSFVDLDWKLDATKALDIAKTRFITVTGKSSAGAQPSPLAIPLTMDGTLEQHLARHKSQRPLPINELGKWQQNQGSGKSKFSVTPEGVWRMDATFAASRGNWTYPRFALPAPLNPAVDYGFLIRARVVKKGSPAIIVKSALEHGVSFWAPEIFPGDGEWHVAYIPFAEFRPGPGGAGNQNTRLDPASWKYLEIGMGSGDVENALEISHFLVVGGTDGE